MSDSSQGLQKIEQHIAELERQMEQLNEVVIQQARELERLRKQMSKLTESVETAALERIRSTNAKPPHYQ
jgi:uncharacterized coiled-coil protein SlyX